MNYKYPESQRVKILRGSLSLRSFAEKFDVTGSNISAIESDRQGLAVPLARKMADYYNVSLDWIYGKAPLDSEQLDDDRNLDESIDIKKYRTTLGLTQETMASELGISRQTLINYENGLIPLSVKDRLNQQIIKIGNSVKIDIKEFIGNRLRELRGTTTIRETYEKLDIPGGRYEGLENGNVPIEPQEILAIVNHYNISIDYLFGWEPSAKGQNTTQGFEPSTTASDHTILLTEKEERIKVLERLVEQQQDIIDIYKKLANSGKS